MHITGVLQQCCRPASGTSQGLQSSQGKARDDSCATQTRLSGEEEQRERNPHWIPGTSPNYNSLQISSFPPGLYGLLPHSYAGWPVWAQTVRETKTRVLLRYGQCFLSEPYKIHPSIHQPVTPTVPQTACTFNSFSVIAFCLHHPESSSSDQLEGKGQCVKH